MADSAPGLDSVSTARESPSEAQAVAGSGSPASSAPKKAIERVILAGFMGAGKTTVGRLLAERLDWRFLDADAVIESKAGATVAQMFAKDGEAKFRQIERETIQELVSDPVSGTQLVLALGGGAIEDERTLNALLAQENALLVHLEASLETVLDRCAGSETIRPLLADRGNLESRYRRRLPLYRRAHLTVLVDARTAGEVAELIQNEIACQIFPE